MDLVTYHNRPDASRVLPAKRQRTTTGVANYNPFTGQDPEPESSFSLAPSPLPKSDLLNSKDILYIN